MKIKKYINSFAWWLYSATKEEYPSFGVHEVQVKVSVDSKQALEDLQKIMAAADNLFEKFKALPKEEERLLLLQKKESVPAA